MPEKVYLAARYSRRLELCRYRDDLHAWGAEVTSRWLDEDRFEMSDPAVAGRLERFATEVVADVLAADTLIAFTEEPRSENCRGGRHVELGIAIGAGKKIIIAGPRENVPCWLPQAEWHPDWSHLAWTEHVTAAGCGGS